MSLQLIALAALGYAGYHAYNLTLISQRNFLLDNEVTPMTPSAFVGYDEPSNTWPDPLMVTFNRPHLPIQKVEPGPYGVPRVMYISQYGHTSHPLYGYGIEKI
jgi:hypothetical protein